MISVVIVAGGRGIRMHAAMRKQYLLLGGRPILGHTLLAFDRCKDIDRIVLVLPEDDFDFCRRTILPPLQLCHKVHLAPGGRERQESVRSGLVAVDALFGQDAAGSLVLVHDAVRPFVSCRLIQACIRSAEKFGACIPALPVPDTLKRVDAAGLVEGTVSRDAIRLAQTPQAFQYDLIRRAHAHALRKGLTGTDDASLVEALGEKVAVVDGSSLNIKITHSGDLLLAEAICRSESDGLRPRFQSFHDAFSSSIIMMTFSLPVSLILLSCLTVASV